jgi:uncharacterized phage-associated protein
MSNFPVPWIRFPFDWNKGIAMLRYLLRAVDNPCNPMSILKLAFFADRYHVRNHARPVSMDIYYAFRFGVGGSALMNIIRQPEIVPIGESGIRQVSKNKIELVTKKIDDSLFSKSDINALDFSIEKFSRFIKKSDFALSEISHAYPEWDQYKELFDNRKTSREDVTYADFLKSVDENHPMLIKNDCKNPYLPLTPDQQEELIEEMVEYSSQLV